MFLWWYWELEQKCCGRIERRKKSVSSPETSRGTAVLLVKPKSVVSSLHLEDLCLRREAWAPQFRRPRTCEAVVVSALPRDGLGLLSTPGHGWTSVKPGGCPTSCSWGQSFTLLCFAGHGFFLLSMGFFLRFPEEEAFKFSSWEPPDQVRDRAQGMV